jgi:hypothetical protein
LADDEGDAEGDAEVEGNGEGYDRRDVASEQQEMLPQVDSQRDQESPKRKELS